VFTNIFDTLPDYRRKTVELQLINDAMTQGHESTSGSPFLRLRNWRVFFQHRLNPVFIFSRSCQYKRQ